MTGSADDHSLAVEAHHQPQRPVGGGVLRTDVEHHVAGVELDIDLRVGEVAERGRVDGDLGQLTGRRKIGGGHADSPPSLVAASPPASSPGMGSTSTSPGHGFTSRASKG